MITLKNPPSNWIYAAGIVNTEGAWTWQGTVIAENKKQATRMLTRFRKEKGLKGTCHVEILFPKVLTHRDKGVSDSMTF